MCILKDSVCANIHELHQMWTLQYCFVNLVMYNTFRYNYDVMKRILIIIVFSSAEHVKVSFLHVMICVSQIHDIV